MQLGERRYRGIAVQNDLTDYRHHPSGTCALGEELEARAHWVPATRYLPGAGRAARRLSAAGRVDGSSSI